MRFALDRRAATTVRCPFSCHRLLLTHKPVFEGPSFGLHLLLHDAGDVVALQVVVEGLNGDLLDLIVSQRASLLRHFSLLQCCELSEDSEKDICHSDKSLADEMSTENLHPENCCTFGHSES